MASVSINGFYKNSLTKPRGAGFQKHHLIPVQLLNKPSFVNLFAHAERAGFDPRDFQSNGIYLPSKERLAIESGRPLHRGPHPRYNELVGDRLGFIQTSMLRKYDASDARVLAYRLHYLQKGLRRTLLKKPRAMTLNKRDPMSWNTDFSILDNDVDNIWASLVRIEQRHCAN